jgi:hypothetical protein
MPQPGNESAVRPLRAAVIAALKVGTDLPDTKIKTGAIKQGLEPPYLLLQNYEEPVDNFHGRSGSKVSFLLKGFTLVQLGDDPLLELYDQCYRTLHRRRLSVAGHLHISGTLELLTTFPDPENNTLIQFVAAYEGVTRNT